jgi:hypothetical protein
MQTFADLLGDQPLNTESGLVNSARGLTLQSDPILTGFSRVFQVRIESRNAPLQITSITLSAP